jgi:hypothetical protein
MNGKIATITKYYRVSVLTIAVVADGTFSILLFALASWFAINCSRATRARPMCLWRFGIWLGYALKCISLEVI